MKPLSVFLVALAIIWACESPTAPDIPQRPIPGHPPVPVPIPEPEDPGLPPDGDEPPVPDPVVFTAIRPAEIPRLLAGEEVQFCYYGITKSGRILSESDLPRCTDTLAAELARELKLPRVKPILPFAPVNITSEGSTP